MPPGNLHARLSRIEENLTLERLAELWLFDSVQRHRSISEYLEKTIRLGEDYTRTMRAKDRWLAIQSGAVGAQLRRQIERAEDTLNDAQSLVLNLNARIDETVRLQEAGLRTAAAISKLVAAWCGIASRCRTAEQAPVSSNDSGTTLAGDQWRHVIVPMLKDAAGIIIQAKIELSACRLATNHIAAAAFDGKGLLFKDIAVNLTRVSKLMDRCVDAYQRITSERASCPDLGGISAPRLNEGWMAEKARKRANSLVKSLTQLAKIERYLDANEIEAANEILKEWFGIPIGEDGQNETEAAD